MCLVLLLWRLLNISKKPPRIIHPAHTQPLPGPDERPYRSPEQPLPRSDSLPPGRTSSTSRYSKLGLLPTELLLQITSHLPAESVACLALTSKHYYATLRNEIDMRFPDLKQKGCFMRLYWQDDIPELIMCRICNILYRWEDHDTCPRKYHHGALWQHESITFSWQQVRYQIHPEWVDAYVRGFVKGERYGPPLDDLSYELKSFPRPYKMVNTVKARVVSAKLIIHSTCQLYMTLPAEIQQLASVAESFTSRLILGTPKGRQILGIPKEVSKGVDTLRDAGCYHGRHTLPAVIMDALHDLSRPWDDSRRCHGLLHCGRCATDARVSVVAHDARTVEIKVDQWHCLGGRDPEQRHPLEKAHFQQPDNSYLAPFDTSTLPSRDLEQLYNAGCGESSLAPRSDVRHSWLQQWTWNYRPSFRRWPAKVSQCRIPSD
ncbi:hypothetical protein EDD37DRAFT_606726 [Exophiala viscosa]|uniref:uncharacterized protein n=1 Tax=Exophiala viscosa TaxID=2486360 RepID=UPI002192DFE8|nr:hypothetical protein EDD37DRAFT_606726 [Exophiala viscosa]